MRKFDVRGRKEIDTVRSRSRASHEGPWVTDYPEMAKKTVLRRLAKLAPMSVQDQRLVIADELADAGRAQVEAFQDVDLPFSVPEEKPELAPSTAEGSYSDADIEADMDAAGRPAPKQAQMPTGVPVQKAAH